MSMFNDQEKEDLIRALDEQLDSLYKEYNNFRAFESLVDFGNHRAYTRRIAVLLYVFTGEDWAALDGTKLTEGGRTLDKF